MRFSKRILPPSPTRFLARTHMSEGIKQPQWRKPEPTLPLPTLKVYNSLTRSKVDFTTTTPGLVTWYNCGPTVYDASHMGHARNYMAQDILRRILRDYFGYEVNFVMNITDVDDKIIVRGRQQHLLEEYEASHSDQLAAVCADVEQAVVAYFYKSFRHALGAIDAANKTIEDVKTDFATLRAQEADPAWLAAQKAANEKHSMHTAAVAEALAGLAGSGSAGTAEANGENLGATDPRVPALIAAARDPLGAWLDARYGATVTDPAISRRLAAYWEKDYFRTMAALGIERPTTLTRVSEYIPEIVAYVEGIVGRGYAYEGGGSVWFDTARFDAGDHDYAKLQPWSKGNRELLEDGEGALTSNLGKRSAADFALWKASKPGEPAWDSPWGPGRPGWHIECSVMASAVLGSNIDVHSGGIDLAFPHHDNELAQSEAYHDCPQWVNYFLHTGHLHIEGLKMSKSLKNFITIDQALEKYTPRQLRLAFLLQQWNAKMDFKDDLMKEVRSIEDTFGNFFTTVKSLAYERNDSDSDGHHHFNAPEKDLLQKLEAAQSKFREALCDSFDTPKAVQVLLDIVSDANTYKMSGRREINVDVLLAVEEWVSRMLTMFGLDGPKARRIGWAETTSANSSVDRDALLMPYLQVLSGFRDKVRGLALDKDQDPAQLLKQILVASDAIRDTELVELGVALDDQDDGKALVKLVPKETLLRARDEKLAAAKAKEERKAQQAREAEEKRRQRLERGKVSPKELFMARTNEFSAFDEDGMPTLDNEGNPVAKSRKKKLQKEYDTQKKLHEEYLASL